MKNRLNNSVTTLVGADTTVTGNLEFKQGCHVAGTVKGDVSGPMAKKSELTVAPGGRIEGNATAARMHIRGTVVGDLHAGGMVSLTSSARVKGTIEYGAIEIEKGAVLTGALALRSEGSAALKPQRPATPEGSQQAQPAVRPEGSAALKPQRPATPEGSQQAQLAVR